MENNLDNPLSELSICPVFRDFAQELQKLYLEFGEHAKDCPICKNIATLKDQGAIRLLEMSDDQFKGLIGL